MKFILIAIITVAIVAAWVGFAYLAMRYPWVPVLLFVTPIAAAAAWVIYDKFILGVKSPPWP